ncbi:MAG: PepSY-like domain-containing protein [Bacteroidota bacterium]|nr:PepSY-like domain-containing protein [Bacteroidota bacterium]
MNYIKSILLSIFTLLLVISCNQFGDDFKLPGENPKDIIYFELDNDYLAPESKEFIETNFSSNNVNTSYVLIGKKTYGFEADLDNQMSLSFDEDGNFKLDRDHPFLKDNYKKGKINSSEGDKEEDKDREDKDKEDKDKEDKDREDKDFRCFEYVMPFSLLMPDSSVITIENEDDKEKVDLWYRDNSQIEKRPKVIFPVSVSIIDDKGDEKVIEITTDEEMRELISSCSKIDEKDEDRCFEIVMPFSFSMPDSSVIVIEKEEDHKKIEDWYKNNRDTSIFSMKRPKLIFPVDIIIENNKDGEEELVIVTVNDEDEMKKISMECRADGKKGKKDRSKKLRGDEVPGCIIEYVNSNYPEDKIVHSRMLKTKSSDIFYIVKLENNGILKFDEDCVLID